MNNSIDDQKTTKIKSWISKLTAQKYGFIYKRFSKPFFNDS